ncbi:MAG: hypothetical protein KBB01_01250 [Candidatus Omnitrophica bacterium]|jgi:hypothetical protein|nr:hypothetical protein [Candidatus Omnitrophota bacterium]
MINFNSYLPGFFSTDESYTISWDAWRIKASLANNTSIKQTDLIAHPFGIDFYTNKPIGYLWFLMGLVLSLFTTPILTYNIQVFINFLLTAFFTYLLSKFLTKNRLAAILSGIIFGFSPYMFVRSWQHLGETYLWPIPLLLWSALQLKKDNTLKIKIIFILSIIFTTFNFDVTYYSTIIGITFISYLLVNRKDNKGYIKRIVFLVLITGLLLVPQFYTIFKNVIFKGESSASAFNPYYRPFEDLFIQSARPLSYFLPPVSHPLFGNFTQRFVGSSLYGVSFTEHTLYLGWFALILAFIAIKLWRRSKHKRSAVSKEPYIGFFVLLLLVSWLFSQPPWWQIRSLKIFMPSFFMYKILPMFRAYCRFGAIVMFSVAVLAGYGLKFILDRFKGKVVKSLTASLFYSLVLFEFWTWPPYKVIDVSKAPAVYYWLKNEPGEFIIAEYPLDIDLPSEMYKFYQTFHNHPIINATVPGTYPNKIAKTITKLSNRYATSVLKWLGVKYVLVHRQYYLDTEITDWIEELKKIPRNSGLKFVRSFPAEVCPADMKCIQKSGPIDVYEVIAKPQLPKLP